uniref:uncharacterized protein CXorf58 homolog n=1 Tax=Euleptes europaea TaxID=460621 RepID=UPI00254146D9|nr:uncharacterized protein CXorf58 homolog [Euleptes europaea]
MQSARKESTIRIYNLFWKTFAWWCGCKRLDPLAPSTGNILEFLQDGVTKKLKASTLRRQVAAIAMVIPLLDGFPIGKHPHLLTFLKGVSAISLPVVHRFPTWRLNVVLHALTIHPLEPLKEVSLNFLRMKVLFLTVVTLARRVSELGALSSRKSLCVFHADKVVLQPDPSFVPKINSKFHRQQEINLPSFCPRPSLPREKSWHTLDLKRALKIYLRRTKDLRRSESLFVVQKEKAAKTIQKAWWIHVKTRLFKLLKHTIRAAEHCISHDILKRVSPLEAELLKDPSILFKVRFRFAGSSFPPFVVFKIFCISGGQGSKYISGKTIITPRSEAAVDACRLMGYRKYYKLILQDELQFKRYRVTDEIDVATVKDYMHYSSLLDETPAYFGGRHNYWRRLSLENFPRTMIMYDIMEYAQSGKMSARLRCELPFLLLRPENEETYHAQLMAVCQLRFVTPQPTRVRPLGLDQQSAPRSSERRSYQARQKIAKMRKTYKLDKEKTEQKMDISTPLTGHREAKIPLQACTVNRTLFVEEEWEKEAAKLFAWSKSLGEDTGEGDLH